MSIVSKRESVVTKHSNDSKAFIENSNDTVDVYENIEECNPNRKHKIDSIWYDYWYA